MHVLKKIENMEALIEAQKRQIMMSNPNLADDSHFQSRQFRMQIYQSTARVDED